MVGEVGGLVVVVKLVFVYLSEGFDERVVRIGGLG